MSNKLQLWYPAKPYVVTQAWGISNPSYIQFGFSRHNGEDSRPGDDGNTYCPLPARVEDAGFGESKGNYARFISLDKWLVDGVECYIGFIAMHHESLNVKTGDVLKVGDKVGVAGNTGFSTGPHTHWTFYRLKEPKNIKKNRLDKDKETDYTFDPNPYWNKMYAVDAPKLIPLLVKLVSLLKELIKKKNG